MSVTGDMQGSSAGTAGSAVSAVVGEELLYESERTVVTLLHLAAAPGGARAGPAAPAGIDRAICKTPIGPDGPQRLRHESAILDRLVGLEGVPRIITPPFRANAIVMADSDGVALSTVLATGPTRPQRLLRLALGLARIVAAVHHRGVVHKDINPANILLSGESDQPSLIDFDLATTFAEELPGFLHEDQIAGTLAYLAPEQTGRTGRPLDHRADLYSLGATLYEMATGAPPFGTGDALRLTRDHLARVPVPPADLNADLPAGVSEIILRLLEKEPDQRYQSAEGLAHDLARVSELDRRGDGTAFPLGEHDFPLRLASPSQPIGREPEIRALRTAFEDAVAGRNRGVLVCGESGVGKTTAINELRPVVAARGGWFLTGKFDQYRQDQDADAVRQALRGLGRLLLAEPEDELARLREHMLRRLGPNAGLVAAVLPEFAVLLGVAPEPAAGNQLNASTRLNQASVDLLGAIVSPARPLVMVVDDLQWAGSTPIGFLDAVLTAGADLSGLLLLGAYRDAEVDAAHPLAATLARWQQLGLAPPVLRLRNLPPTDLARLIGEMLRLEAEPASRLAGEIAQATGGNPYDTVELVNALRRDGTLVLTDSGWTWDAGKLRHNVHRSDVTEVLAERMRSLPPSTCELVEVMACLGGEVDMDLLQVAGARPAQTIAEDLQPALEDGLLVMEQGGTAAVRFRHDRIHQVAFSHLSPAQRRHLHLSIARRLAALPALAAVAAEQYLPVVDTVDQPAERRRVVDLLRSGAANARLLANYAMVERLIVAAQTLIDDVDDATRTSLATERHTALYSLGRLEEGDEVYDSILQSRADVLQRVEPACVQICSLTNRVRHQEALALGLDLLGQLGHPAPDASGLPGEIARGIDGLYRWIGEGDADADSARPEIEVPEVRAAAMLINRLLPAAFFSGHPVMPWLVTESGRIWSEHGPAACLVGPLSYAAFMTTRLRQDRRAGDRMVRRVLAVAQSRGYQPDASQARYLFALGSTHWFEPIEETVRHAQLARTGLIQGGDLQSACFTYYASVFPTLSCSPTLDGYLAEAESGLAFAARTRNDQVAASCLAHRQLARTLRGETVEPGSFTDASFDEAAYLAGLTGKPAAAGSYHVTRAIAALIFGDQANLVRHAATTVALLPFIESTNTSAWARILQALALAAQVRAAAPAERTALLAELTTLRAWLADRAADSPGNFGHLRGLVDGECAWAVEDFRAAAIAFDDAQSRVVGRGRPWHQALIYERAGRFHLGHGLEHLGRTLLADARQGYADWGASAKVTQLDRQYPALKTARRPVHARPASAGLDAGGSTRGSTSISTDTIDLLAVLAASQALSSETSLDRLRDRVVDVLGAMTGATAVHTVVWSDDRTERLLVPGVTGTETPIGVAEAAARGLLPLSAFRYAERTRAALLVEDATRDDRFARDPYLTGLDACSLLIVPLLSQGVLRAMLILENRLSRGAFSADRVDAVMLIAGQLVVSLDNALVYASLERKVAERTEALQAANERLELLSVTDPLTGLANRRKLAETLESEWQRALRSGTPLAIAMIDIDHFKQYNDLYGHLAGDRCLRRVAAVLNEYSRRTDLVARYGGEEFAIVLPGADITVAHGVAERVRAAVAALEEPHARAERGIVSISVGVAATVPVSWRTPQSLTAGADEQLYEAKRSGRNQVAGHQVN